MKRNELTLEEYVKMISRDKRDLWSSLKKIREEIERGSLGIEDPDPPDTYVEYLFRIDYSLWFWTSIAIITSTLLIIYLSDIVPALIPLRYVLGSIFVLFLPGYSLIEALYPEEKSLSPLERLALSIGLSLAVIPLIGLLLNYTPWGIRLTPIVFSVSMYMLLMLLIASYRKYSIATRPRRVTRLRGA